MSSRHASSSSNGANSAAATAAGFIGARHTIFLRVHSADNLSMSTSQSSYCNVYIGDTPVVSSTTNMSNLLNENPLPGHRTFHTKVTVSKLKTSALWNEKFEVPVDNIKKQILSIRVKSQHQLYSPSIGSCAIPLKQLKIGSTINQSFPLFKGSTQCGTIRLQMMIRDNYPGRASHEEPVKAKRVPSDHESTKLLDQQYQQHQHHEHHHGRDEAELDAEERQRKQRERLEQERQRIEQEMEQLRTNEEERVRRKFEEEERRMVEEARLAEERAVQEREKEKKRRREEQERLEVEELGKKLLAESHNRKKATSFASDNQRPEDDASRTSSSMTVLTNDDRNQSAPDLKNRRSGSRRRLSTLSLHDLIDHVVKDALPSDSDSDTSSNQLDTEDEHEFIRAMAKLKLKLIKRKKMRRQSLQPEKNRRSTLGMSHETAKHDLSTKPKKKASKSKKHHRKSYFFSSSSSSSSSSASDSDARRVCKPKKKSSKATHTSGKQQGTDGMIMALTPGQLAKKSGSGHSDQRSMNQAMEAAVNVAKVAMTDNDDDLVETVPATVDALQSLVPIGKFFGRKIHEASARVAQMKEKEQPTYYA